LSPEEIRKLDQEYDMHEDVAAVLRALADVVEEARNCISGDVISARERLVKSLAKLQALKP
jgi:hypothetical protein